MVGREGQSSPRRSSMKTGPTRSSTAPSRPCKADGLVRAALPPSLSKRSSLREGLTMRRHPSTRPTTSPHATHATHAMMLQLQEYHDRLEKACGSTFSVALQPPPKLPTSNKNDQDDDDDDSTPATATSRPPSSSASRRKPTYCRARILQLGSRDCFQPRTNELAGAPPPAFSTRVGVKDCVLPAAGDHVYVSFHQTTPRCSEYLYGNNQESARRMRLLDSMASAAGTNGSCIVTTKDHFALGPGQYDVPPEKPSGLAAAAKFSPSDRFHENYSTDHPGPGQYITSETLVSPRPAAAVFSQRPRETDLGALVSPTANVVSSYYYVPESAFRDPYSGGSGAPSGRVGWSRTARFQSHNSRHDRALLHKPPRPNPTDFVARNVLAVQIASTAATSGRHPSKARSTSTDAPQLAIKRRSSLVASLTSYRRATQATLSSASRQQPVPGSSCVGAGSNTLERLSASVTSRDHVDVLLQSWLTIAYMASAQMKLMRFRALLVTMQRIRRVQHRKYLSVTFTSWKKLDVTRSRQDAAQLIARNARGLRLWLRIEKKRRHATMLRTFLRGLSFDVRFALSMKRIKRKIMSIQRWWRHVQLMVRAREEALYHKWITVENRMRLDYINQLPHLQRVFTPPAGTAAATGLNGAGPGGTSVSGHGSVHASDLQVHKLLNLPDQQRWFPGRFVLSSDGSLRGYALDSDDLLVEIRSFRCHFHDVSAPGADESSSSSPHTTNDTRASYTTYTNAAWKPFLMLFRQGAFRFVVITSLSPLPTEIHSWKDKLERLTVNPTSSIALPSFSSGTSFSAAGSYSDLSFFSSVSDLVEVSMQSGILAPAMTGSSDAASSNGRRASKIQARMRSIRQRTKSGMNVAEGSLNYYVVDLLKDLPKVPSAVVWATIRDKLREKRKAFRAEIYRYKLEMFHYQEHQQHVKHMHVLAKFRDFFTLERPRRPHFRSLISNRKMESIIRATAEQVKSTMPSNPRVLLDATALKQ